MTSLVSIIRFLNRTRGRDRLKAESMGHSLTGPEEFTFSAIIMAYTRRLYDEILREEVFAKSGASCNSLWRCQEVIIKTQRKMELMRQYEDQAAQNHELQRLRDLVLSDYGQLSSVVLAAKDELSLQDFAPQHKNLHPQPPLYSSHKSRGQGNTIGRGGMQNSQEWRDATGPNKEGNPHPPQSSSLNPYVNMSLTYDKPIHLSVGYGVTGYVKPNCKNSPLQLWVQSYLKQMVFGGPGISAHLLVLEYQGYTYEKASATSSVLSNLTWAPSLKEYCTQRITDAFPQRYAKNKIIVRYMKTENYVESEYEEEPISLGTFLADPARKLRTLVGKPEKNWMKAFFQASPDAAKESRKMSQRLNTRKKLRAADGKKGRAKAVADSAFMKVDRGKACPRETPAQSDFNIDSKKFSRVSPEHKAFRLVTVLRGLVNAMAFPRFTLSREHDDLGLFVSMADGGATELKEFTCCDADDESSDTTDGEDLRSETEESETESLK
ncbi:hypothetical protein OnM2_052074 [Erysiphe neolycopersici]|uniref:Uncharacterized protein n=1 Tax=Erysiphe neolycopersici TaxID=212602 RepID=A0A420HS64_9PEZI|nr:hypothetical protein OnM2_052074 [Erysiphe neolycopersici]